MQSGFDISDYLCKHGPQVTAEDVTAAINKSTEFTENNKTETGTGAI